MLGATATYETAQQKEVYRPWDREVLGDIQLMNVVSDT